MAQATSGEPRAGDALLTIERASKRFGAVQAVHDISLAIEPGRIHAVVGENGAGKSTLLQIAAGLVAPDEGRVLVGGSVLAPHTPREAIRRGVGMVQQHFAVALALTALDNVMLGAEPTGAFGRLDVAAARARADAAAGSIGVTLPWDARVDSLGVGDKQRLEIVRTLVRGARVVILDEPTAVLTPVEADRLYATLRRMAAAGRAVVVVTHHLDEVRDHADRVTVLRRGALVVTRDVIARDDDALGAMTREAMGDDPAPTVERRARAVGEARLDVRGLRRGGALAGVTMTVRAGEIVGIAGVDGNGQNELVRAIAGLDDAATGGATSRETGEVRVEGGVAVVHEDRAVEGLVLEASVQENLVLGELGRFTRRGLVDGAALAKEAQARLERAGVVPARLDLPVRALSGGNQQKVVVARAVARADRETSASPVSVLVFSQPTRGVDSRAARAIHAEIARMADAGTAVLVVSADLAELRALADRILVMAGGKVVAELPPDAPLAAFGEAMLGARRPETDGAPARTIERASGS